MMITSLVPCKHVTTVIKKYVEPLGLKTEQMKKPTYAIRRAFSVEDLYFITFESPNVQHILI